jgi:hypothetical protein
MRRWANRILFSILVAIAVVPSAVMLASVGEAGVEIFILGLFAAAMMMIDRFAHRHWMALDCLPPYSDEVPHLEQ